jgi:DNA polymerase elongation subunit (family B)
MIAAGDIILTNDTLVIDIETIPHRADAYKAAFPKSKKKPGLHSICSEIVCVGLSENGHISILDRQKFDSERDILQWLAEVFRVQRNSTFVSFNGKSFDFPHIQMRSALYGIPVSLPDKRSKQNVDIYEAIGGKWQTDTSSCSLRELIWFKYNELAATDSGDSVADLWAKGDLAAIATHCEEDVRYTAKLYNDFKGILF